MAVSDINQHMANDNVTFGVLAAVVTGLIGMMWLLVKTLAHSKEASVQAGAANRAVNDVGETDQRLYDMVSTMKEDLEVLLVAQTDFSEKGWKHLPSDIGDAPALTEKIRGLERDDKDMIERLKVIQTELLKHIEREKARDYHDA